VVINIYLLFLIHKKTNSPIENYFNQIKHYLKLNKKVLKYNELNNEIKNVKKENYMNYFNYAYKKIILNHINLNYQHFLENLNYGKQHKNIIK